MPRRFGWPPAKQVQQEEYKPAYIEVKDDGGRVLFHTAIEPKMTLKRGDQLTLTYIITFE